jgi:hypothetical protein
MCPYEDTLELRVAGKAVMKSRNWLETHGTEKISQDSNQND